jgi:cysteine peptidase C11 family protein
MNASKPWTVLVWIAGDNNLQDAALDDVGELKAVGSGDAVNIAVQLDRMASGGTRRYYLRKDTTLEEDAVQDLGETNTGDPAVAIDFFQWGMREWPSDKVLAVLWNHGSGIDETDVYARAQALGDRAAGISPADLLRGRFRAVAASGFKRSLFSTTIDDALTVRGIGYDDSARDFLDNAELKRVLQEVTKASGRPIDVLGFDACLMNMVEVPYELRGLASFIVGSEETEPGAGWPYTDVVGSLAAKPDQGPQALAAGIVDAYLGSYPGNEGVTQSALDVERSAEVSGAVDQLAVACVAALDEPAEYMAFDKASKAAQRFYYKDFVDLGDLCAELHSRSASRSIKTAAQAVLDALTGSSPFVIASGSKAPDVSGATGASIYLPDGGNVTVAYDRLDFGRDTHWAELIAKVGAA